MTRIHFAPQGLTYEDAALATLSEAAAACDIFIEHPCGGRGHCAKCRVRFIEGAPEPSPSERKQLSPSMLNEGWRLACQCAVSGEARVEITPAGQPLGAQGFGPPGLWEGQPGREPVFHEIPFRLSPPRLENQESLLESLESCILAEIRNRGLNIPGMLNHGELSGELPGELPGELLGELRVSNDLIRHLPARLAALGHTNGLFHGAAFLDDDRLMDLLPPGKSPRYGAAIDLGTTTLALAIVDLASGEVMAVRSALNPQARFGADVIARITYSDSGPDALGELTRAVRRGIADLLRETAAEAGADPLEIAAAALCGNSTMTHLFAGIEVRSLGLSPFAGVFSRALELSASEAELPIHPSARVWVFPLVRSHLGGDAVAGLLASGADRSDAPILQIDLGTNAEVALGCRDWIVAATTAAGPAFEGHSISCGMRAAPGAIDRVSLGADGDLRIRVMGGNAASARGICGSGLIDAAAALLRAGALDPSGRLLGREEYLKHGKYPKIAERLARTPEGRASVVLSEGAAFLDQDFRALQLVKGAVRAGVEILLGKMNLSASDLSAVYLAGTFGNYLRKSSVLEIGMLPAVDPEKVLFLGDAPGIGARMVLADRAARRRALAIAARCEYVELAAHPEYAETFAECMAFPAPPEPDSVN